MPPATNALLRLQPKKYTLKGPMQTEQVEDLFETVWKNKGTLSAAINSINTALAAGDIGAAGANGDIQFNRNGLLWAEPQLNWENDTNVLRLRGVTTGRISVNPQNANYVDMILGGHYGPTYGYIPEGENLSYIWHQAQQQRFGWEMIYDETPGAEAAFAKGIGFQAGGPDGNTPRIIEFYQYGGLGTGAAPGLTLLLGNNDSGSGAAATLGLRNRNDTAQYIWPDANGAFRFHSARPLEDDTVSDTVAPDRAVHALSLRAGANYSGLTTEGLVIAVDNPPATSIPAIIRAAGSAGAATGGNIQSQASRGTIASPTALASGDYLGGWFGMGYHSGGAYSTTNLAAIRMLAAEAFTATNLGTDIDFATTAIGATSRVVKSIITSAGLLVMGSSKSSGVPALKPSSTTMQIRLGDDSNYAPLRASNLGIGTNGGSTFLVNIDGGVDTQPRIKVNVATSSQFSTSGAIFSLTEVTSGHEEWHFYAQKDSAGAATGGSSFGIRRRNASQSEATSHLNITNAGHIELNSGFTAGSGASLQGNVGIKMATPDTALTMIASGAISWSGRSRIYSLSNGTLSLYNAAETDFDRITLGGITSSFPSISRNGAETQFRLADDSALGTIEALSYRANGSLGVSGSGSSVTVVGGIVTAVSAGGGATVVVDAAGALDGDGSIGDPLAVIVDGSTIIINGSNELEVVSAGAAGFASPLMLGGM